MNSKNNLTIVETFVGCGGSHMGFSRAGFQTLFINDINPEMINTIKNNTDLKEDEYYVGSIEKVSKKMILEKQGKKDIITDVLCGGVVCKGFSLAGVRNPSDIRNYLYLEQLRLVKELQPKVSVIENVPQFKTTKILRETQENKEMIKKLRELYNRKKSNNGKKTNQRNDMISLDEEFKQLCKDIRELEETLKASRYSVFEDIQRLYKELGYNVYDKILICADYGDYTYRKRFFIVAIRNDVYERCGEFSFPEPTHDKEGKNNLQRWKTVNECFEQIDYEGKNHPDRDIDNKPMNHNEKTIRRFSYIPEGGSLADTKDTMPEELRTKKIFSSRGSSKRLAGDKCCPTLVPGHSAFPVHPKKNRSITIREGACLTGFPPNYIFSGSHTKRCEQIGNAIPVNVAYHLGMRIQDYLKSS
jgi:DNA (cytosine-5)-methyltransferase 1